MDMKRLGTDIENAWVEHRVREGAGVEEARDEYLTWFDCVTGDSYDLGWEEALEAQEYEDR